MFIYGLKFEHYIYNKDFSSRLECERELDRLINDLEDRKYKIMKYHNKDYHDWDNSKSREIFSDVVEDAMQKIADAISHLENLKGELR